MTTINELNIPGYEKVIEAKNSKTGLHAFIAIHDTTLGPALGGTRFFPYNNSEEALQDVLKLAKAMSYKSSVIQDGLGGGKSVIIGDPRQIKNKDLLHSFSDALNYLKGSYIAAEDVGTTPEDMDLIHDRSPFVAGLPSFDSCGDPSRFTAYGVYRGMQAVAKTLWGTESLAGKRIVVQGLGNVGMKVAEILFWEKAELLVSDIDQQKVKFAIHAMGAKALSAIDDITTPCDIVAPCAMGGILTAEIIRKLQCQAVAGGANNQLSTPEQGVELFNRGILYAPDYVINAGGIINAAAEFEKGGYNPLAARNQTDKIFNTLMALFETSKREKKPTHIVADEMAEYNIRNGIGKRVEPIQFSMI